MTQDRNFRKCQEEGGKVGENRAAVFLLFAKNRTGVFKQPLAGRRLKLTF